MLFYQNNYFDKGEMLVDKRNLTYSIMQQQYKETTMLYIANSQQISESYCTSKSPPKKHSPTNFCLLLLLFFILGYIAGTAQNFSPETLTCLQSLLENLLTLL